jgi:hypothetical protein
VHVVPNNVTQLIPSTQVPSNKLCCCIAILCGFYWYVTKLFIPYWMLILRANMKPLRMRSEMEACGIAGTLARRSAHQAGMYPPPPQSPPPPLATEPTPSQRLMMMDERHRQSMAQIMREFGTQIMQPGPLPSTGPFKDERLLENPTAQVTVFRRPTRGRWFASYNG